MNENLACGLGADGIRQMLYLPDYRPRIMARLRSEAAQHRRAARKHHLLRRAQQIMLRKMERAR